MRSSERLHQFFGTREFGRASTACAVPDTPVTIHTDLRLFALTFAWGFLFTSIFIA